MPTGFRFIEEGILNIWSMSSFDPKLGSFPFRPTGVDMRIVVLFTLVVYLLLPIRSQEVGECQVYSGGSTSLCSAVAPSLVYIPPGQEQAQMQLQVSRQLELYVSGVSSEICSENAIRWLCGKVFASCVTVAGRPTPLPPCPSRCDEYANSCRSLHDLTNTEIVCPVSNLQEQAPEQCNNYPLRQKLPDPLPQGECHQLTILDTPRSHCSEVISYPVFVPAGITLPQMDEAAASHNYFAVLNVVSPACADATMEFVCAEIFPRCQEEQVGPSQTAVLSAQTCYMSCYAYNQRCKSELLELKNAGTISASDATLPVCEEAVQISSSVYSPLYPPQHSTVSFPSGAVTVPCTQPAVNGVYQAPRCEKFAGFPSECASLDIEYVWVEADTTQEQMAAEARVRLAGIQGAPTSCRRRALRVVCGTIFRACEAHAPEDGLVLYSGRPICAGFCEETLASCKHQQGFDMDLFTCDVSQQGGYSLLPTSTQSLTIAGWQVESECFVPQYKGAYPILEECPFPFERTDDEEDVCDYQCPSPVYSEGQYRARLIVSTILGYLGTILGFFTALSFLLHPLKRTFPRNLVAFQVFAAAFLSLSFLIPHWVMDAGEPVYRDSYCENAWTEANGQTNGACGAESFFGYCFHLSVTLWYVVVAAFLVKAVFAIKIPHRVMLPLEVILHAICWGAPIIVWICLISTGHIDSSGKDSCFVSSEWWGGRAHEVFFYYPLIILMLLGMLLVALAFVVIVKKTGKQGVKRQFRVILYLLYTFLANGWVIFEHFFEVGYTVQWQDSWADWRMCSLISLTPCTLEGSYPFGMDLTTDIVIASKAIFLSLILLQDTEIWVLWGLLIQRYILRRDVDVRETLDQRDAVRRLHKKMNTSSQKSSSDTVPGDTSDWGAEAEQQ